jgi:hypothetical protein
MRVRTPVIFAMLSIASLQAEDGGLQRARDEIHRPPSSPSSAAPRPPGTGTTSTVSGSYASDSSSDADGAVVEFIFWAVAIPVMSCFTWWGDEPGPGAVVGVERYPYHDGWNGYFAPHGNGGKGRLVGGEAYAEYGLIDNDIDRYAAGGRLFLSALALRTEWNRYLERLPSGGSDSLTLGTIDLELGIPCGRHARVGLGLGATIVHDAIGTESGLCGVVGVDVFPLHPLVLHGVFTYGTVSEGRLDPPTDIMTLRATVGAIWNHYEAYAGWQSTWIESVQLSGPTAGVRVWF